MQGGASLRSVDNVTGRMTAGTCGGTASANRNLLGRIRSARGSTRAGQEVIGKLIGLDALAAKVQAMLRPAPAA